MTHTLLSECPSNVLGRLRSHGASLLDAHNVVEHVILKAHGADTHGHSQLHHRCRHFRIWRGAAATLYDDKDKDCMTMTAQLVQQHDEQRQRPYISHSCSGCSHHHPVGSKTQHGESLPPATQESWKQFTPSLVREAIA